MSKKKKKKKNFIIKLLINFFFGGSIAGIASFVFTFMIIIVTITGLIAFLLSPFLDDKLSSQQNTVLKAEINSKVDAANASSTFDETGQRIGELVDYFGTDDDLKLNVSYVTSYLKYLKAYGLDGIKDNSKNRYSDNERLIDCSIKELTPKFYYKRQTIKTVMDWTEISAVVNNNADDGIASGEGKAAGITYTSVHHHTESEKPIYVLTKAENFKNNYEITYTVQTSTSSKNINGSDTTVAVTAPSIDNLNQTLPDYEPLRNLIKARYKGATKENIEDSISFINNLALNYINQSDDVDWLFQDTAGLDDSIIVDSSVVPAQLLQFFKSAESEYHIPWWFIAGESYVESSFVVGNENTTSHCFGLMQSDPRNWLAYGPQLGYADISVLQKKYNFPGRSWNSITTSERANMVVDLRGLGYGDNPQAQIRMGVYQLSGLIKTTIDWNDDIGGLKDQLYKVLDFYSGSGGDDYIDKVLNNAFRFKGQSDLAYNPRWPVLGYTGITSPYGQRIHTASGKDSFYNGIDIGCPEGSIAVSAAAGVVEYVGTKGVDGLCVIIKDAQGDEILYGHLHKALVTVGTQVSIGDKLATTDSTGASTGNNLYFEIDTPEGTVDPVIWLQGNK